MVDVQLEEKKSDQADIITAAILVIGDEILSGRTQDKNIHHIAKWLADYAIDLCEVRVVRDDEAQIITAIQSLKQSYRYVFTTGGIGPTHDDITADCVAKAVGKELYLHPEAYNRLLAHYGEADFTTARQRMARVPKGAKLIDNPVSIAPGFEIDGIFVMAGVPKIMQAMLEGLHGRLQAGAKIYSDYITLYYPESAIADALAALQDRHDGLSVGSYPFFKFEEQRGGVQVVMRARQKDSVVAAYADISAVADSLGIEKSKEKI